MSFTRYHHLFVQTCNKPRYAEHLPTVPRLEELILPIYTRLGKGTSPPRLRPTNPHCVSTIRISERRLTARQHARTHLHANRLVVAWFLFVKHSAPANTHPCSHMTSFSSRSIVALRWQQKTNQTKKQRKTKNLNKQTIHPRTLAIPSTHQCCRSIKVTE